MLGNRKLVLDTFSEVYDLLRPWADAEFWNFSDHEIIPGAIYLISRKQFNLHTLRIRQLAESGTILPILSNPMEGSDTMKWHCEAVIHMADLVHDRKILLISGGEMDSSWPYLRYDIFLTKILDYDENLYEISRGEEIFTKTEKPYKFLFLNGRGRHHRKFFLELFRYNKLLDSALWTNLDVRPFKFHPFVLPSEIGIDSMDHTTFPVQHLPEYYEVERYRSQIGVPAPDTNRDLFVKYHLFNDEWGDIYLNANPYIDTYFSLVTETVFEYPYSFRTEKTWKPIAMGHPTIFASNAGYYRDFHNLGFRTWGHLIDESFDQIDNVQDRIDRIAQVVKDLCRQDLPGFLQAAEETCKYNQQHLAEMRVKVRQEFPDRFFQFIEPYINE
jgi:hypothetical protein